MDSEYHRVAIAHLRGCLRHTKTKHIRREYEKALQFARRKLEICRRRESTSELNIIRP